MKKKDKTSTKDTAKRGRGRPFGSKDKKKRKRKKKEKIKAAGKTSLDTTKKGKERPLEKKARKAIKEAYQFMTRLDPDKEEEKCNIKVGVVAVKADGTSRIKIKREKMPEVVPAEKLVFKIIYERNGVSMSSVTREVREFAEALMQSIEIRPNRR